MIFGFESQLDVILKPLGNTPLDMSEESFGGQVYGGVKTCPQSMILSNWRARCKEAHGTSLPTCQHLLFFSEPVHLSWLLQSSEDIKLKILRLFCMD